MRRRGRGGRALVAATFVMVVVAITGPPTSGAPRVLWTGDDVPDDLVQEPEAQGYDIDDGARGYADVDSPGPVGGDGCATVPVIDGVTSFFLPKGELLPTRFTAALLCDLPGGGQELRLTGETLSADQQEVLGTGLARFFRADPGAAFSRFDLELTDGRCFAVGSLSGYPGDGTAPDDYVVQGWNYDADPTVDCSARTIAQETTSTTTAPSTTTSQPPVTSTTAAAPSPGAAPAQPVAGAPSFAG
jgi:hypothetical protein